ncbi:MAG: hypothetical protein V9E94_06595 [Microthrixaceae bacterium]
MVADGDLGVGVVDPRDFDAGELDRWIDVGRGCAHVDGILVRHRGPGGQDLESILFRRLFQIAGPLPEAERDREQDQRGDDQVAQYPQRAASERVHRCRPYAAPLPERQRKKM